MLAGHQLLDPPIDGGHGALHPVDSGVRENDCCLDRVQKKGRKMLAPVRVRTRTKKEL
jgi:hypothetical protein